MPTAGGTSPRKRRGKGGCCGCLVVLLLLLGASLWLARKWAPNHLNRGLAWTRVQIVHKYPALDRWLPQAPGVVSTTVFEPTTAPVTPTVSPAPSPAPSLLSTPDPIASPTPTAALESSLPIDLVEGTGVVVQLGQTLVVRYTGSKPGELPERLMLGASDVAESLDKAIRGMRVGGKRKIGMLEVELIKIL